MKDYSHIMIISGGTCNKELAGKLIMDENVDTVIAVDGGLKIADELGLVPDYIVGDFDTIDPIILEKYRFSDDEHTHQQPKILAYKPEKDDTDTEIAIRLCTNLHPQKVVIIGGTGTRLDHTLGNIHLLKKLLDMGIDACIYDDNNKIYLIDSDIRLLRNTLYGNYFSLLPLTEQVKGITLRGFKYPLEDKDISIGTSLCISNQVIDETAVVEVKEGILIVFESQD